MIALIRLTAEFSTPFLAIRWILLNSNRKDTQFYKYNSYVFAVAFTLCRILPIVPIWLKIASLMKSKDWIDMHILQKGLFLVSNVPLDFLNLYWYSKIVRTASLTLFGKNKDV